MLREFILTMFILMLVASPSTAQIPIPDMELHSDGTGLEIVNTADAPYLLVNVTVMWQERDERWTHYPDELIMEAKQSTSIPYSAFTRDYAPGKELGTPSIIAFILLSENDKYVALNFERGEDGGYTANEKLNRELTQLYQRLPPPKAPDTGR